MTTTQSTKSIGTSTDILAVMGRSLRKPRRGAAVVEFAIVAPVFILLVFGMIEFGRMVMVQQMLTNASREGARMAVVEGAVASNVITSVRSYLTTARINNATITVSPSNLDSAATGDPITVTTSVSFQNVSWLPVPMYIGNRTLTATSVMRRESSS